MTRTLLKIILLLYFSILVFFINKFLYIILFILILYVIKLGHLKIIKALFIFTIFTYLFFILVFSLRNYSIDVKILQDAFFSASLFIEKILILSFLNLIFVFSTSKMLFLNSLKQIGVPKNLRLSFFIIINILPNIFKKVRRIYTAQRLRGLSLWNFFTIDGWKLFIIPSFIYVFSYAEDINIQLYLKDYLDFDIDDSVSFRDFLIFLFLIFLSFLFYF